MSKIEIPHSKSKLLFGIGGSIIFVLLGLYLCTAIADQQTRFNPTLVICIGLASILFFGVTGINGTKKIFEKSVGLTIDDNGIIDNTNAASIGIMQWLT